MKIKFLCILLTVLLICCHQKGWQKSAEYRMSCYEFHEENYLKILDDNNNEIMSLAIDKNGSVIEIHTDYKGFYFSAGFLNNGELHHLVIRDENTMYNSLTELNREESVLVYREEQYQTFSQEYRLFEDGKTRIKHWDYINEVWLED
jgi:hypothetical protein